MLTVPERLRDHLQFLRDPHDLINPLSGDVIHHSRGGVPFHHAWEVALARVCDDLPDGDWWRRNFEENRATWRRCYLLQEPTKREAAMTMLAQDLDCPLPIVVRERRCRYCGRPLEGRPNKLHCSDTHRRKAEWLRERARKARDGGAAGGFKSAVRASA